MRYIMRLIPSVVAVAIFAALANAQEVIVYPAQGQSAEQQEKDKFECYNWSKQNSGFDPMAPPTASTAPPQSEAQQGGVGQGAVRGGVVGVGVGAIADRRSKYRSPTLHFRPDRRRDSGRPATAWGLCRAWTARPQAFRFHPDLPRPENPRVLHPGDLHRCLPRGQRSRQPRSRSSWEPGTSAPVSAPCGPRPPGMPRP